MLLNCESTETSHVDSAPVSDCFSFIESLHPFYPKIQRFKQLLVADRCFETLIQKMHDGEDITLRTTMKAPLERPTHWKLKRVCLSFQFRDISSPFTFQAFTFVYSPKKDRLETWEFPKDPCLTDLASIPAILTSTCNDNLALLIEVLRYVPRRRLTFRTAYVNYSQSTIIGKCVQRSEVKEAYTKFDAVWRAAHQSKRIFRIAEPLGMREEHGIFFQEAIPGRILPSLITMKSFQHLLSTLGTVHQNLHCLDVVGLPEWKFDHFLTEVQTHANWVAFFQPAHEHTLGRIVDLLLSQRPMIDTNTFTFCHGDFGSPQVLVDGNQWAVIDFDSCVQGDPYLEIAMTIAFFKYHVPLFKNQYNSTKEDRLDLLEEAIQWYLRGYEEHSPKPLNRKRLLWYWMSAELIYLGRMLRRDLFHTIAFVRTIKLLQSLSRQFEGEPGRAF